MKKANVLFVLLILVFSCEKDNDIVDGNYSDYINGNTVSTEIDFYPVELYEKYNEPDTASLKIRFTTTEIFPCVNYHLATTEFETDKELIIRFDSIQKPTICFTAIGPANSYVVLPSNITKLVLINGNSIDRYNLDITVEKVRIIPIESDFSNLKESVIFRYPENTFVYECNMDTSETDFFNDFLRILTSNLSIIDYEFSGDGKKPYAEDWVENKRKSLTKYFKFESETEFIKAGELLNDFVTDNSLNENTSVYISLKSWNNQKYLSWMMPN